MEGKVHHAFNLMEKKLLDIQRRSLPAPGLTPAQQRQAQRLVSSKARALSENPGKGTYVKIWRSVKDHFQVGKYSQIPSARFDELVRFLGAGPARGCRPFNRGVLSVHGDPEVQFTSLRHREPLLFASDDADVQMFMTLLDTFLVMKKAAAGARAVMPAPEPGSIDAEMMNDADEIVTRGFALRRKINMASSDLDRYREIKTIMGSGPVPASQKEERLNAKLDADLKHRMKVHCVRNGITIQSFIEDALREAMKSRQ